MSAEWMLASWCCPSGRRWRRPAGEPPVSLLHLSTRAPLILQEVAASLQVSFGWAPCRFRGTICPPAALPRLEVVLLLLGGFLLLLRDLMLARMMGIAFFCTGVCSRYPRLVAADVGWRHVGLKLSMQSTMLL